MQSQKRIKKIKEANWLLSGKPEPRPMKVWRVVDGKCADPEYPADVMPQDIIIHVQVIKESDSEMINHRKRLNHET